MNTPMTPEEIQTLARKRANAKMGWYMHAAVYVLVNLFIFAASKYAFGSRSWSVFPLLGWGLGLALHGVSVFMLGTGSGLREKLERKERERIEREQSGR